MSTLTTDVLNWTRLGNEYSVSRKCFQFRVAFSFAKKLRRFCVILFYVILRNKFSLKEVQTVWISYLWDCTFFANNRNAYKGTDYLPKTLFCNLMRDGTLQMKMCTISHKIRAAICQLLILNWRKKQTHSILKCICLGLQKKYQWVVEVKPKV